MEWKLELVPIPVSDVDRAKPLYTETVGFKADHDVVHGERRVVQLTPPGSAGSIVVGTGIVDTPPGSVKGLHLVVSDIQAAGTELAGRGVEVSDLQDLGRGVSLAWFGDPDGNSWALQELPDRGSRPTFVRRRAR